MATRGETFQAEEQRHGLTKRARKRNAARKKPDEKRAVPGKPTRVGRKATYARELPSTKGRASRKSTRSSANRAKPDTNLNLREERQKGSPENRYRKAKARGSRVRGAPASSSRSGEPRS